MTEAENNIQETKPKTSKWAIASMYSALIGLALILLSCLFYNFLFHTLGFVFEIILFGFILIGFGFAAGIIGLICIKVNKGELKGIVFAILGIIVSFIPIALFGFLAYGFYEIIHEKPYDDSNPEAIMAKVERVCDFDFPDKMESLKAAEKLVGGIDPGYTFIARFTTDQNSFAELRNSLPQTEIYSEEINADKFVDENGNNCTYGSRTITRLGNFWRKNVPQWFDTEIPKGKIYELHPDYNKIMHFYFICVELPDSNVVVNVEGLCINRALIPKLASTEQ